MPTTSPARSIPLRRVPSLALLALLIAPACGGGGGGGGGGPGPDPAPTVSMTEPASTVAHRPGDSMALEFTSNDNAAAPLQVIADPDGSLATPAGQVVLLGGFDSNGAIVSTSVVLPAMAVGVWTLFTVVDDGVNPAVSDPAPGSLVVYPGLAGVAPPQSNSYGVVGSTVGFAVGEAFEPGGSLNPPDADAGDAVPAFFDAGTGLFAQGAIDADDTAVDAAATARVLSGAGGFLPWNRLEADAGNLNGGTGDGDAADSYVAYALPGSAPVFHPRGGGTVIEPLAGGRIAARFAEAAHGPGGADLNGDLDTLDEVIAFVDAPTNLLSVPQVGAVPGTAVRSAGGTTAYYASEAATGFDYNGDADFVDTMLVVVNPVAPPGPSLPVAVGGVQAMPFQVARTVDATAAFAVTDSPAPYLGYFINEALTSPGVPLNGDADATDFIPAVYDAAAFAETILAAGASLNGGAGARIFLATGSRMLFAAMEEGIDRNGDGDGVDAEILFWVDLTAPGGAAPLPPGGAFGGRTAIALDGGAAAVLAPGRVGLVLTEIANGLDLNGDLDVLDRIFMIVDTTTSPPTVVNTLTMPGAAGTIPETGVADASGVLLRCAETANGIMNGDGDAVDVLIAYFSFAAPGVRVILPNTGGNHAALAGGVIAVTANESLTTTDLNGDGDATDFLFRAFDTAATVLEPGIRCPSFSVPAADDGSLWAFLRDESAEGRSLNGDADSFDFVLGLWARP